jgi:hypothetical protein
MCARVGVVCDQGLDWDAVLQRKVPAPYTPPVSGEAGVDNFEEVLLGTLLLRALGTRARTAMRVFCVADLR